METDSARPEVPGGHSQAQVQAQHKMQRRADRGKAKTDKLHLLTDWGFSSTHTHTHTHYTVSAPLQSVGWGNVICVSEKSAGSIVSLFDAISEIEVQKLIAIEDEKIN